MRGRMQRAWPARRPFSRIDSSLSPPIDIQVLRGASLRAFLFVAAARAEIRERFAHAILLVRHVAHGETHLDAAQRPAQRSEERRVGKGCRSRWSPCN